MTYRCIATQRVVSCELQLWPEEDRQCVDRCKGQGKIQVPALRKSGGRAKGAEKEGDCCATLGELADWVPIDPIVKADIS